MARANDCEHTFALLHEFRDRRDHVLPSDFAGHIAYLAQLGKLAGVDFDSHLTDEVALQVDMPLLRQLVGQGPPPAKPKAPAKKSAKGKK